MSISTDYAVKLLKDKGVKEVFHANTVATACNYLNARALLSREYVESRHLPQTEQKSDKIDKDYGIYNDIFLDKVDIHKNSNDLIVYGPVCFVFDIDILLSNELSSISITRTNPIYWKNKGYESDWMLSDCELSKEFDVDCFGQQLVLRNDTGMLTFGTHLKYIRLDDPCYKDEVTGVDFYSVAYGALAQSMSIADFKVKIVKQKCGASCKCIASYKRNIDKTRMSFFPRN